MGRGTFVVLENSTRQPSARPWIPGSKRAKDLQKPPARELGTKLLIEAAILRRLDWRPWHVDHTRMILAALQFLTSSACRCELVKHASTRKLTSNHPHASPPVESITRQRWTSPQAACVAESGTATAPSSLPLRHPGPRGTQLRIKPGIQMVAIPEPGCKNQGGDPRPFMARGLSPNRVIYPNRFSAEAAIGASNRTRPRLRQHVCGKGQRWKTGGVWRETGLARSSAQENHPNVEPGLRNPCLLTWGCSPPKAKNPH